jgi:hypothetical protein
VAAAAELGQEHCDVEDARASQHGVGRAAAQQRSDAWNVGRQEVARVMLRWRAAVKHSSGRQSGGVSRRGQASARAGSGGVEAGVARGEVLSSAETAGAAHMAGRMAAARGRGEQRRGRERGRRRGTQMQYHRNAGALL